MKTHRIKTERLELVATTEELAKAEITNRAELSFRLDARVPDTWPPKFNDIQTMTFVFQQLQDKPEVVGWWSWYFVLKGENQTERVLIGNGGFKGPPDENASVEIGYSVLGEYQKQGYGSEAITGLINWDLDNR